MCMMRMTVTTMITLSTDSNINENILVTTGRLQTTWFEGRLVMF